MPFLDVGEEKGRETTIEKRNERGRGGGKGDRDRSRNRDRPK
jgi:hypothetical protein